MWITVGIYPCRLQLGCAIYTVVSDNVYCVQLCFCYFILHKFNVILPKLHDLLLVISANILPSCLISFRLYLIQVSQSFLRSCRTGCCVWVQTLATTCPRCTWWSKLFSSSTSSCSSSFSQLSSTSTIGSTECEPCRYVFTLFSVIQLKFSAAYR